MWPRIVRTHFSSCFIVDFWHTYPQCVVCEMVQKETARDGRCWLIPFGLFKVEGRVVRFLRTNVPWSFLAFPLFPHSIQLGKSGAAGAKVGEGIWRVEMA